MKTMLILAPYPTAKNIKDGYMQRVMAIDKLVNDVQRDYLSIRSNPFGKTEIKHIADVTVYRMNRFQLKIKDFLSQYDCIYIHSIYMYKYVHKFITNQKTILDLHGVVPEELSFNHKYFSSMYYGYLENKAAHKIDIIIFVTEAMKEYFGNKYPQSKAVKWVFPIIAKNSLIAKRINNSFSVEYIKNPVVFVYSGNIQKWQNIKQMLGFIKKYDKENYIYIILSSFKKYFFNILDKNFKEIKYRFIIDSVLPEELYKYYSIAHYGFLIRDDHILNKVSCPTKMLEYLFYGITPIIKLKEIGDFFDYESIGIFDENIDFFSHKSEKNKQLAIQTLKKYSDINLLENISKWRKRQGLHPQK
jgi:hypothetical protein